jgi:hypothetical protein
MQAIPYPLRDDFAGGIFEAGNVVEVVVIQLLEEWGAGGGDLGEVEHPAGVGADGAGDVDLGAKGVAVKPGALVILGDVGEAMGRLERELFEDFHCLSSLLNRGSGGGDFDFDRSRVAGGTLKIEGILE